ncbi:hypothetical protein MT1_3728 [Pseudomonas sp. MT-1]|uniref:phage nozzle protein n=1 Tax=Stutzerimonas stutzeri TaxID=316 RepID=UPI000535A31E|nr:hypothetical protein [Stutzerimonas stutzeri]MCQ4282553.1 hypothetical protein [Stutzerimonas stutzeri]BAP80903.1 hypothetical protein MT1_3728 [Pseudomonas sp. MT-1]
MGTSTIQPSFAAGELAPSLYARVDLARYQTGLRLCSNFFVMPYGGVKNRPGTVFVSETKSSGVARLIPFQFNDEQTYVLEFGNLYMRVYKDGGIVEASPGVPYELVTPFTEEQLFDLNYTQSADVMTIVHPAHVPQQLSRLGHDNWTLAEISFVPGIAAPGGLTGTPRTAGSGDVTNYRYVVTAVIDSEVPEESLPSAAVNIASWDNKPGAALSWSTVAGATYYNVYKDTNSSGIFGFIGRAENVTFTDINIAPVKTDTPPTGNNPFVGVGNYPGAVGYYQQRLCFAGSDSSPQTVWMSKTGNFKNFGYSTPVKDDDSITFTVASRQVNRFRHILPLRQLLGLTSGGEWVISGGESGITAKTVKAEIQSYNGASKIPPIVINDSAIYVQQRNNAVSSLAYTFEADGFSGDDLTKFSPHFFRGYTLIDWTYQQIPDRLVWAARNDGALLGMTFLPEEQLLAWHQHHTDGFVESVCCIAEGQMDALYLLVRRNINGVTKRYVERMATRDIYDAEDAFFVDCGLTYDGRNKDAGKNLTLSGGAEWKHPQLVTVTATGHAPFTPGSVGRTYRLRSGAEMVRVEVTAYTSSAVVTGKLLEICPVSLRGVAVSDWALMAETIAGLGHLEGKTVAILTDGDAHPQRVVSGGAISLQHASAVVHAGLPYVAEMETLEIDWPDRGSGSQLDKRKIIPSVTAYLEASRNFWAGPKRGAKLFESKPDYRETYDSPVATTTGVTELKIDSVWQESGRVYIQQPDPLPLTILALIPEITVSGKS